MNIGLISPAPVDGTSFYRGFGVMPYLRKLSGELDFIDSTQWSWAKVAQCDLVFMQRPYAPEHLQVAKMCRDMCVPLWLDYDDNLFDVPFGNPSHDLYMTDDCHSTMRQLVSMASVVTVSTMHLGTAVIKNACVIENAHNDYVFPLSRRAKPRKRAISDRRRIIAWRGSGTHGEDMRSVWTQIEELAEDHPDWSWHFFGSPVPKAYTMRTAQIYKYTDIFEYFRALVKANPDVLIVPLEDNQFNRSKSDIAAIEGAYAGATIVCPEWWDLPGIYRYDSSLDGAKTFYNAVTHAANKSPSDETWDYILQNRLLSKINTARENTIRNTLLINAKA